MDFSSVENLYESHIELKIHSRWLLQFFKQRVGDSFVMKPYLLE